MENGQMNYVMGGNSISMAGTDSISDLTRKEAIKEFNKANKKAEDAYRKNIDEQIAKSNENKNVLLSYFLFLLCSNFKFV